MRKLLLAMLLICLPCVAHAQTIIIHNSTNYNDSIVVAVIPGRKVIGQFQPPAIYHEWWKDVMKCSALSAPERDIAGMRFYWVSGDYGFAIEGGGALLFDGWSSVWTRQIYILDGQLLNKRLVMHEMLHFLLWENAVPIGLDGHPKKFFVDKCHVMRPT